MFEPGQLRRKAAMEFPTCGVLAFSPVNHNVRGITAILSHDAGNLIPVFESAAADGAYRLLPITLNEKRPAFRCKQDRNLLR